MTPIVVVEPPSGWVPATFPPPPIAENTGATLTSFRGSRAPGGDSGDGQLVSGCVAVPIPGWVEDMRAAVEARTLALAGAAAERILGFPVDARSSGGSFDLRAARDLGPVIGKARTFIGFDSSRVFSCFAACVVDPHPRALGGAETGAETPLAADIGCARSVAGARLEGSQIPPAPGLALRGVTWAVHHPRPAAFGGGIFVVLAGLFAVIRRRRPRSA